MGSKYNLVIFTVIFFSIYACTSSKRYPCPSYNTQLNAQFDSTGAFTGGYRHNKDKKTGLIKKKKDRRILDRRGKDGATY